MMAFIKSICAVFSLDASVSDQVLWGVCWQESKMHGCLDTSTVIAGHNF